MVICNAKPVVEIRFRHKFKLGGRAWAPQLKMSSENVPKYKQTARALQTREIALEFGAGHSVATNLRSLNATVISRIVCGAEFYLSHGITLMSATKLSYLRWSWARTLIVNELVKWIQQIIT